MKKVILTTVAALTFSMGTPAFAEEPSTNETPVEVVVEPGTTPDSFLYTFDRLMEDIKLLLTFDTKKEAELLLQFSQERLAEAKAMTEAEKQEFVEKAVNDYLILLKQAEEKVTEVVADEGKTEQEKVELTENLEKAAEVTETVAEQFNPEQKEAVQKTIDQAYLVAKSVAGFDLNVVKNLREQEYGYGQIAKIISLANITGKSVEEITGLLGEEADFGQVMKQLNVNIHQVKQQVVAQKVGSVEAALEAAVASGDGKEVAKLEKKLENLNKKNENFAAKAGLPVVVEEETKTPDTKDPSPIEGTETLKDSNLATQTLATNESTNTTTTVAGTKVTPVKVMESSTKVTVSTEKPKTASPTVPAQAEKKPLPAASEKGQAQKAANQAEANTKKEQKKAEGKKETTSTTTSEEKTEPTPTEPTEVVKVEEPAQQEETAKQEEPAKKDANPGKGNKEEKPNKGKGN